MQTSLNYSSSEGQNSGCASRSCKCYQCKFRVMLALFFRHRVLWSFANASRGRFVCAICGFFLCSAGELEKSLCSIVVQSSWASALEGTSREAPVRRAGRRRGGKQHPHWSAGPVESDHCHANLALPLVSWQLPCGELGVAEKDVMPGKATKDPKRHPPGVGNCWMLPSSNNQDGRLTAALLVQLQLRCPLFVATLLEIPAQRSVLERIVERPGLKRRPLLVPAFAPRVGAHCDLLALVGGHHSFGSGRVCLLAGHLCSSSVPKAFSQPPISAGSFQSSPNFHVRDQSSLPSMVALTFLPEYWLCDSGEQKTLFSPRSTRFHLVLRTWGPTARCPPLPLYC